MQVLFDCFVFRQLSFFTFNATYYRSQETNEDGTMQWSMQQTGMMAGLSGESFSLCRHLTTINYRHVPCPAHNYERCRPDRFLVGCVSVSFNLCSSGITDTTPISRRWTAIVIILTEECTLLLYYLKKYRHRVW